MKSILLNLSIAMVSLVNAQTGGNRICGKEFASYGLNGMTYSQALDYVASIHNEYQDYLLNYLSLVRPDFIDTNSLKTVLNQKSAEFFLPKNLPFNPAICPQKLAVIPNLNFEVPRANYSEQGYSILSRLKDLLIAYDPANSGHFLNELMLLKEDALQLANSQEVFKVGIPVSIAISSYTYWGKNGQSWLDTFSNDTEATAGAGPSVSTIFFSNQKPKINLWHVGGADVVGAINGATGGGITGPGGAFAGAVLVSSVSSLGNLVHQVINSYVSWWPF